jgi:hypothetical protein
MLIWDEVVPYYDDMHAMSFNDVLRDFDARSINIPMCLDGNLTSLHIIWVMSSLDVPVYIYSPKLWNICMLVWQGYDVNGFCIWMSDVKFGCICIPIFSEVVEYLYACILCFGCPWLYDKLMSCFDVHVYLYSPKLWNICMLLWSGYDVVDFHVWMCLYTYILRSCGIFVCLYNQAMRSLILYLEMHVCLSFPKLQNACMRA